MKALIRYKEGRIEELILETDNIPGIDWETGMPLTSPDWAGGPYTLVEDYVPEDPEYTPVTYTAPVESVETTVTTETVQEAEVVETPAPANTSTTRSYGPIFDI